MDNLSVFGQRVKQLRQELGLSQRDFAEKIGITASALSSYEKGLKNPSVNVAINIASIFSVSLDWLCGLKNETNNFHPDAYTPFDLPNALSGLLQLQFNGLLQIPENSQGRITGPVSKLIVDDGPLQEFLYEIYQFEILYFNGSLSPETYHLCVEELTEKTATSIQHFRKKRAEKEAAQQDTDTLPF